MLRLIENGWLTENTLLEIDEPETNLHPQWVVELAHLLVCINKTFGTKILITSHNPDMVSAIRYISEKEDLLNTTRFYLAEQRESSDMFDYKDLGSDIEPVFGSFNKSFDTLQKYVENYGEI
jgi:predicted ATPase